MNFLFSVIYPGSKKFFDDFINSVNIQTSKDFTLVLCLNGTNLNKKELNKIKVKYLLFKTNLDWRNARVKILKKLLKLKSEYIIFADSDDIMSKLRIEISLKIQPYLSTCALPLWSPGALDDAYLWHLSCPTCAGTS